MEHVADLLDAGIDGLLWDVLEVVYHIFSLLLLSLLQALEEETLPFENASESGRTFWLKLRVVRLWGCDGIANIFTLLVLEAFVPHEAIDVFL
jgi:hypothetical protein